MRIMKLLDIMKKTNGTYYTLNGYYTIGSNLIYFVSDINIVQY